jgi:small subunit ribosomal protein S13
LPDETKQSEEKAKNTIDEPKEKQEEKKKDEQIELENKQKEHELKEKTSKDNVEPPINKNVPDSSEEKTSEEKKKEPLATPKESVRIDTRKEEKKAPKKKEEKDKDFKYIVRIANTDIDGEKTIIFGLSQIKGVGRHMAVLITDEAGLDRTMKVGKLSDAQIEKIQKTLENLNSTAPPWMLNHRKDLDTGKDIHLLSSDVSMRLRDDINLLKMIRSYRGIRHESGLPVRGQRTRGNNRKGLALGVSKKRP